MKTALIGFFVQEDGAVTVDWVVLSAAIIGLSLIVVTKIAFGTTSTTEMLTTYIRTVPVGGSGSGN